MDLALRWLSLSSCATVANSNVWQLRRQNRVPIDSTVYEYETKRLNRICQQCWQKTSKGNSGQTRNYPLRTRFRNGAFRRSVIGNIFHVDHAERALASSLLYRVGSEADHARNDK